MRNNQSHRIISLTMALLMFCSSVGFSIDLHYCQGHLKHFSILGEAKSCHNISSKQHCNKKKKSCHAASVEKEVKSCKKDCCSNKTIEILPSDDVQINASQKYEFSPLEFAAVFVQVFILGQQDLSKYIVQHQNYAPPLLSKDIPILIQSFLL